MALGPPRTRREWRWNALLSSALIVVALVLANQLARRHVRALVDLSEERLAAPSPVGTRMLEGLDDVLDVRAYFTGRMRIGPAQIAKQRLVEMLERWEDVADGRLKVSFADPNESTEERVEARALGIVSVPIPGREGSTEVTQEVFLGLRLRLGEREAIIPWTLPQTLESQFFQKLYWLNRGERPVLGFVGGTGERFETLRARFEENYDLREVTTLAYGDAVPAAIDVLVVVDPVLEHPRAVYEVEQFVQRGGRALFLVDPIAVDLRSGRASVRPTGYEDVLAAWGVAPSEELVWDVESCNRMQGTRRIEEGGRTRTEPFSIPYPAFPNVGTDGLSRDAAITANVAGASLFWAAALGGGATPDGVHREELLRTSERAYLVPPERALATAGDELSRTNLALAAGDSGRRLPLAVALTGLLPSAFRDAAPLPLDAVSEARFRDAFEAASETLGPWPERRTGTVPAEPLGANHETAVVVIGDADLVSKSFLASTPVNGQLVANAIDWLALSPELLELRARVPKERAVDDFLAEERSARGLLSLVGELTPDEARRVSALEEAAQARAASRRNRVTAATLVGALALALGGGALARWLVVRGGVR
ncbi:MAG: GldG family protein [Planctomycetota bacterium]